MTHQLSEKIILLLLCLAVGGCAQGPLKKEKRGPAENLNPADRAEALRLMSVLTAANSAAAASISGRFHIDGVVNRKKLKIMGTASYQRNPGKMYVSVVDYIFRSPLMTIFRDGNTVRFYYPAEKKIIVDSFADIELRRYSGMDIPFRPVYGLLTGSIPLIENYSIRKCLTSETGRESYLILENDEFFETIFFKKDIPGKLLLVRKSDRSRFEFYLRGRVRDRESVYYRKITMVSEREGIRVNLVFDSIVLNRPVSVKTIDSVKTGPDVKYIHVDQ